MRGAGWSRVTHPFATLFPAEAGLTVRLACVRHAASVHPEPGSNSPFERLFISSKKLVARIGAPGFAGKPAPPAQSILRLFQYPSLKVLPRPRRGRSAAGYPVPAGPPRPRRRLNILRAPRPRVKRNREVFRPPQSAQKSGRQTPAARAATLPAQPARRPRIRSARIRGLA